MPQPTGWQTLGGALPGSGGLEQRPAIATDAQGEPTVAFLRRDGVTEFVELNVLRLVGAGWQRAAYFKLAVAAGTPGAPVAVYGVDGPQGGAELQAARYRP